MVHLDLLAAKYRTRLARRPQLTSLHIFVVTLRCEHSCAYCQVSRVSEDRTAFDMTPEMAYRAIAIMLEGPADRLKVEFQGGEPLFNFELIRHIVHRVETLKGARDIAYVITSNLSLLNEEILDFCAAHKIIFSTSLDGPEALHNLNRPRPGQNSHAKAIEGIESVRKRLGPNSISALMTTTLASLSQPEAIIDEYIERGFKEIFLRFISPYGFAVKTEKRIGYETDEFIDFFKRGLAYILDLNRKGQFIRELYSTLLLRRILTPYADGYVDLQNPAGIGLSVLAYNYDGDIYASDEGRMLAAMNDHTFRLGNVFDHDFKQVIAESPLLPMIEETMLEGIPGCCDCVYQPWCGSDPVFHHRTQGDPVGHMPSSAFCHRQMAIFHHLIGLLQDPTTAKILRSWLN